MHKFETYRGFVYPACIDHVGHMNVQSYVARFDEASWHFLAKFGLGPLFLSSSGCSLVALEQRIGYKQEVRQGALLDICSELLEVKPKNLRYRHRMNNSETGLEVASMELVVAYFSLSNRKTTLFPSQILENARALLNTPE
jgi:acyl-CoA thioester hydrolase